MPNRFEQILINKNASVKEAMKQLDKTAEKILFVVEEDNILLGSLTDGDIRRWILNGGSLSAFVSEVCFKGTFYVKKNYVLANLRDEMRKRKIDYVPVVDKNKKIVEILIWNELFGKKILRDNSFSIDAEIVIMAGGKGTRLDPFTKVLPKALIPINNKTIIEIIIEKFLEYEINKFYLAVNYKSNIIKSFFDELNPNYQLVFIEETQPLGTIGALKYFEKKTNKDILLTNCDIVIDLNYNDFFSFHKSSGNDVTLVASLKQYKIPYGVCRFGKGGELIEIEEKPEYDFWVNTGMYLIKPELLKFIPANQRFDANEFLDKIIKSNFKIGIYPISEDSWIDIGQWSEYKKSLEKINNLL